MVRLWQVAGWVFLTGFPLMAEEPAKAFSWPPLQVRQSLLTQELCMLDAERDEYATNLGVHAGNRLRAQGATPEALADGRRMIALALHLSPRNKRALVLNFQLSKQILPDPAESPYSGPVFARLLLTRGRLLEKQAEEPNQLVARFFTQLAAELDPKNEDAVYAFEVQRLDHGLPDWSVLMDPEEKQP
jgi:hypothetical protein